MLLKECPLGLSKTVPAGGVVLAAVLEEIEVCVLDWHLAGTVFLFGL